MHKRKAFQANDLKVVGRATHEEIITGDFVWLASGSPIGLVNDVENGRATVTWLTNPAQRRAYDWRCLRTTPASVDRR